MSRPNVLLIHVDQHRADCLGAAGHPLIQTPALDRLAREGVHFTHAFTPIPVCTPARASLLTGTWPTTHGLIANADAEIHPPATLTLPTISQTLADAGYYVGHVGKWHVHPTLPPTAFGCHDYISARGYAVWRRGQGIPPQPRRNGFFGEADPYITPEQSSLAWAADRTIDLLRQAAQRDRAFFVRWDPGEPHLPNVVPEPYASLYLPASVTPWPSFSDPLTGKPYIQHKQRTTWGIAGWTWHEWAPIVARYLGEITLLDHQVGRILAALDEFGLAGDTPVIYSSDHGDLCGGHGLIDKHFVMYDDLVRVPLIVRQPGVLPAGVTSDAFVCSSLDIAATIVAAAGCPLPATFAGLDLAGQITASPRQDIFSTYYGNQLGLYSQRMVRDRGWKYVWNVVAEDELYDLADDPGEIRNRATDPACARELRRLRARMLAWLEHTHDRVLNPWTHRQLIDTQLIDT